MDSVLQEIIVDALNSSIYPSDQLIFVSHLITSNKSMIDEIQDSFTSASKIIINSSHMSFIVKYDCIADGVSTKEERYKLMKQWNVKELLHNEHLSTEQYYSDNLQTVLDSEIELSLGCNSDPMKILYHRTRSFAHSLLFTLKKEFISFITNDVIKYIFYCSLAAVIMDDADDIDEDTLADSPTIFSTQPLNIAFHQAFNVIGFLESKDSKSELFQFISSSIAVSCNELTETKGDSLLNIFLCFGISKCKEIRGGSKSFIFDTKKYLKELSKK
jgi:hypothetical protein